MERQTYHPYYLAEVEAAEERAKAEARRAQRARDAWRTFENFIIFLNAPSQERFNALVGR